MTDIADLDPARAHELFDHRFQRPLERVIFQRIWTQLAHGTPYILQSFSGRSRQDIQLLYRHVWIALQQCLGRIDAGGQSGQRMSKRIMYLPGQAITFSCLSHLLPDIRHLLQLMIQRAKLIIDPAHLCTFQHLILDQKQDIHQKQDKHRRRERGSCPLKERSRLRRVRI